MICHEINSRQLCLPPARYENQRWFALRMSHHCIVHRLPHCHKPANKVALIKRVEVYLERNRSYFGRKVEETFRRYTHPLSNFASIRKRGTKANHSQLRRVLLLLFLGADETHTGDDHFHRRTSVTTEEMNIVNDAKSDGLHSFALPPSTTDSIPLLCRADDNPGFGNKLQIRSHLARQLYNLSSPQDGSKASLPIRESVECNFFLGSNVDTFSVGIIDEHPHDGKLGTRRLSRTGRCTNEAVLIRLEQVMECLSLDGVEFSKVVEFGKGSFAQD
mmetsp:Transcript_2329/g.5314  ORF Transcript_2329/g.5314 Transcript_2329/m.5314 type:complete len:275 (-) Transcript_2329:3664-4488(-)